MFSETCQGFHSTILEAIKKITKKGDPSSVILFLLLNKIGFQRTDELVNWQNANVALKVSKVYVSDGEHVFSFVKRHSGQVLLKYVFSKVTINWTLNTLKHSRAVT